MNLHSLVDDPKKLTTFNTHISPEVAYERLAKGDKTPGLVAVLAQDPKWAYNYARHILDGPFLAGEKAIASDPEWAYYYACDILGGPFPASEKTLASSAEWAYNYANYILKGPFPAGEEAIASNPISSKEYQSLLKQKSLA